MSPQQLGKKSTRCFPVELDHPHAVDTKGRHSPRTTTHLTRMAANRGGIAATCGQSTKCINQTCTHLTRMAANQGGMAATCGQSTKCINQTCTHLTRMAANRGGIAATCGEWVMFKVA